MAFKKAVKHQAKGRVALVGSSGAGKSYTMLTLAKLLAGPSGKIAAIDTEHGSLSKYSHLFNFDVDEPTSYSPEYWLDQLTTAEQAGYDVFCCDSLSHFWMGKDGALEFVDEKAKINRDSFSGWKAFRPHERAMVDRMLASPCHVIVTMRTQTEYVEEVDEQTKKKKRKKIGLKPVQREGLEYEFDLVGYMDEENTLIFEKTRVLTDEGKSPYAGRAFTKPSAKDFEPFRDWLSGEPREKSDFEKIKEMLTDDTSTNDLNQKIVPLFIAAKESREGEKRETWNYLLSFVRARGNDYDAETKTFVMKPV